MGEKRLRKEELMLVMQKLLFVLNPLVLVVLNHRRVQAAD